MSLPRDLFKILTLRCEEASELTSRELDEPLRLAERLAARGHSLVCGPCRQLRRQLRFLRDAVQSRGADLEEAGVGRDALSPEARTRIENAIAQASPDGEPPGRPG